MRASIAKRIAEAKAWPRKRGVVSRHKYPKTRRKPTWRKPRKKAVDPDRSITTMPRYRRDGTQPKPAAPRRPPRVIKCRGGTLPISEACGMCFTCRRRLYMRQWRKIQRRKGREASWNAAIRVVYLMDVHCRRLAPIRRAGLN